MRHEQRLKLYSNLIFGASALSAPAVYFFCSTTAPTAICIFLLGTVAALGMRYLLNTKLLKDAAEGKSRLEELVSSLEDDEQKYVKKLAVSQKSLIEVGLNFYTRHVKAFFKVKSVTATDTIDKEHLYFIGQLLSYEPFHRLSSCDEFINACHGIIGCDKANDRTNDVASGIHKELGFQGEFQMDWRDYYPVLELCLMKIIFDSKQDQATFNSKMQAIKDAIGKSDKYDLKELHKWINVAPYSPNLQEIGMR